MTQKDKKKKKGIKNWYTEIQQYLHFVNTQEVCRLKYGAEFSAGVQKSSAFSRSQFKDAESVKVCVSVQWTQTRWDKTGGIGAASMALQHTNWVRVCMFPWHHANLLFF